MIMHGALHYRKAVDKRCPLCVHAGASPPTCAATTWSGRRRAASSPRACTAGSSPTSEAFVGGRDTIDGVVHLDFDAHNWVGCEEGVCCLLTKRAQQCNAWDTISAQHFFRTCPLLESNLYWNLIITITILPAGAPWSAAPATLSSPPPTPSTGPPSTQTSKRACKPSLGMPQELAHTEGGHGRTPHAGCFAGYGVMLRGAWPLCVRGGKQLRLVASCCYAV